MVFKHPVLPLALQSRLVVLIIWPFFQKTTKDDLNDKKVDYKRLKRQKKKFRLSSYLTT